MPYARKSAAPDAGSVKTCVGDPVAVWGGTSHPWLVCETCRMQASLTLRCPSTCLPIELVSHTAWSLSRFCINSTCYTIEHRMLSDCGAVDGAFFTMNGKRYDLRRQ